MVISLSKNQSNSEVKTFISDLADIKFYESRLLDFQCWQMYYQDLEKATELIRSLLDK